MLSACSSCSGFLPPSSTSCPHCGKEASTRGIGSIPLVRGLFAAATGGVTALTLMACYGIAPCTDDNCGTGAGGDGTTGTTGSGGAGGGTTANTTGSGGAGGGTACTPCADVASKLGTSSATVCAADKAAFEALVACACTTSCTNDCGPNTCAGKEISAACQTCMDTSCKTEETACSTK
ncbi:MAG: hypothetical protein ABI193_09145 [Minicystis sp.]